MSFYAFLLLSGVPGSILTHVGAFLFALKYCFRPLSLQLRDDTDPPRPISAAAGLFCITLP